MKRLKVVTLLCAVCLLATHLGAMTVSADETTVPESTTTSLDNVEATGLIMTFSLSISSGTKQVKITGITLGTETMAKIGFKNIEIQRSSNGSSGWTKELDLDDDVDTNSLRHRKDDESHTVAGGYYYRVKLDVCSVCIRLDHCAVEEYLTAWAYTAYKLVE